MTYIVSSWALNSTPTNQRRAAITARPVLERSSVMRMYVCLCVCLSVCLQCFDAVGWAGEKASGLYKQSGGGAGVVICLEPGADLHMAQLMPLPLTVCCFSKIQIGFTFLVPAHPGSPGERAVKRVCVCVCSTVRVSPKPHLQASSRNFSACCLCP